MRGVARWRRHRPGRRGVARPHGRSGSSGDRRLGGVPGAHDGGQAGPLVRTAATARRGRYSLLAPLVGGAAAAAELIGAATAALLLLLGGLLAAAATTATSGRGRYSPLATALVAATAGRGRYSRSAAAVVPATARLLLLLGGGGLAPPPPPSPLPCPPLGPLPLLRCLGGVLASLWCRGIAGGGAGFRRGIGLTRRGVGGGLGARADGGGCSRCRAWGGGRGSVT